MKPRGLASLIVCLLGSCLFVDIAIGSHYDSPNQFSGRIDGDRVILEFQPSVLGKDFLIVRMGSGQKLVRWVREGDTIQLVAPEVSKTIGPPAHPAAYLGRRLANAWQPAVLDSFPIMGNGGSNVLEIDATDLFLGSMNGLPAIEGRVIQNRSKVLTVSSDDNLVEVASILTFEADSLSEWDQQRLRQRSNDYQSPFQDIEPDPLTLNGYLSILQLPDRLMRPRQFDARMGFFHDSGTLTQPQYPAGVLKWRLQKKNPERPVSSPIQPIVFHFGKEVPAWVKPYLREGVESWNPAFEAAGYSRAVVVRDESDEGSSIDDRSLRKSVIRFPDSANVRRYLNQDEEPYGGGTVEPVWDPRTGELLKVDLIISAPNDVSMYDYYVMCGALDKRARKLPFSKELRGELYRVTAAHEAGHAFGLVDGNYGEYTYPTKGLRDIEWLRSMGFSPSVMNYSRCNYVAQPEDNIPPDLLQPRVGPADVHQIRWGYTPIGDSSSWEDERPHLEEIVNEVAHEPWLQFVNTYYPYSPQTFDDAIDADDPIESTRLGLKNLRWAFEQLPAVMSHSEGGSHLIEQAYHQCLRRWSTIMNHVASLIGGYTVESNSGYLIDQTHVPIPAERQREAMRFLAEYGMQTPSYLVNADITRRFQYWPGKSVENVVAAQLRVLDSLLRYDRLEQIVDIQVTTDAGQEAYGLQEYLDDVRQSIWSELQDNSSNITPYRQQLQLGYLDLMTTNMASAETLGAAFVWSSVKGELDMLRADIERSLSHRDEEGSHNYLCQVFEKLSGSEGRGYESSQCAPSPTAAC